MFINEARIRTNLSVSSVGSEAMQHHHEHHAKQPLQHPFQYPRSDRRRCNEKTTLGQYVEPFHFQYPRSDRRRCNSWPSYETLAQETLSVSSVGSEAMQRQ